MSSTLKLNRVFTVAAIFLTAAAGLFFAILLVRDFSTEPQAERVYPYADEVGVEPNTAITLHFNKKMLAGTIVPATFVLRDEHSSVFPAKIAYDNATRTAVLQPSSELHPGTTYEVTLKGSSHGILDRYHHPLPADKIWRFTTGVPASGSIAGGPGGPILLITSKANSFSQYCCFAN
ncbi:MAG: Ig-like domain-containing protein [Edaphobacter sp.]